MSGEAELIARKILDLSYVEPVNPHDLVTITVRYKNFCKDVIPELRALKSHMGDLGFVLLYPNEIPGSSFMQIGKCRAFVELVVSSSGTEIDTLPPEPTFREYVKRLANSVLNAESGS